MKRMEVQYFMGGSKGELLIQCTQVYISKSYANPKPKKTQIEKERQLFRSYKMCLHK